MEPESSVKHERFQSIIERARKQKIQQYDEIEVSAADVDLPIHRYRQKILQTIEETKITMINAPTGSGKTTQVPQFIYDNAADKERVFIVVTQPRRIATITNAERVANERKCVVGDLVGYQIGLEKHVSKKFKTRILYVTTGVLLEMLIQAGDATRFTHVILDEVHERSADMDLLLTFLKEFLYYNSDFKLILMSATMEIDFLRDYYTYGSDTVQISPEVLEINVEPQYSKKIFYLDDLKLPISGNRFCPKPQVDEKTMEIAKDIILEKLSKNVQNTHILVFLPGLFEIKQMQSFLKHDERINESCIIMILHSEFASETQKKIFAKTTKSKIVLSTNIAESSITIPDVTCVIDFCLAKYIEKDPNSASISRLRISWTSQNNLQQRAGRTSRTCEGEVYRLIFKLMYNDLYPIDKPEMERCSLERVVLKIKKMNIDKSPGYFLHRAPSPPLANEITEAILTLKELGALHRFEKSGDFDPNDGDLTIIGRVMAALPVDIRIGKLIILGYMFSILDEAIIIGAGLSTRGIFQKQADNSLDSYEKRLKWSNESQCDFTAILNAYNLWVNKKQQSVFGQSWNEEVKWCREHHLNASCLNEMLRLIEEIKSRLNEFDFQSVNKMVWVAHEKPLIVKIIAAGAFYPNYFISGKSDESIEMETSKRMSCLKPERTIFFQGFDPSLIPELYEDSIKQMIVDSGISNDTKNMRLTFDSNSTKFFVEFLDNEHLKINIGGAKSKALSSNMPGLVPLPVYKTAQAKKNRMKFELKVMNESDAMQFIKDSGLTEETNRSYSHFYLKQNFMAKPALCVIPSCGTNEVDGFVVHIHNPEKFFVQLFDDDILKQIDSFLDEFTHFENIANIKQMTRGELFIVDFNRKKYRAKVEIIESTSDISVRFVDYGYSKTVEMKHILKLDPENSEEIFKIPERCFEARLSHIAPSFLKCPEGKWTKEAMEKFKNLVLERRSKIQIYSVENECVAVSIKGVNEDLIENKFARHVDEIFSSREDHLRRRRYSHVPADVEFSSRKSTLNELKFPLIPRNKCIKLLKLKEPYIPITSEISNIFADYQNDKFIVSPDSVNSILCKSSSTNYSGSLLVAANILKSGENSVLHETSLMPDIPGFTLLMALIFAPQTALKLNNDGTRFEYVRAGLGCNPIDGRPYFLKHDLILPIDIDISIDEFATINKLRYAMSKIVDDRVYADSTDTIDYLGDIKDYVVEILSRERLSIAPLSSIVTKNWPIEVGTNQVIEINDVLGGRGIFNVFNYTILNSFTVEQRTELKNKLENLKNDVELACGAHPCSVSKKTQSVHCWVCDQYYQNNPLMKVHLESDLHKQTLKMMKLD